MPHHFAREFQVLSVQRKSHRGIQWRETGRTHRPFVLRDDNADGSPPAIVLATRGLDVPTKTIFVFVTRVENENNS